MTGQRGGDVLDEARVTDEVAGEVDRDDELGVIRAVPPGAGLGQRAVEDLQIDPAHLAGGLGVGEEAGR